MTDIPDLRDTYIFSKKRIVLTENELCIPGVRMFGRHMMNNATRSILWHYHKDSFEFSIPAQGTFSFSTEAKDYVIPGGEVFLSFPDEIHGSNQMPVNVGDLYWFQIDMNDQSGLLFLNDEASYDLKSRLFALPHHTIKTDIKKTLPLIRRAFELAVSGADCHLIASFLYLFLQLLILDSDKKPFPLSPDIRKVRDAVLNDPARDFSLEELADMSGLSCSQFKQKFKNQLGISPRHFINIQKIEYAKKLLTAGKTVTEVSMILNFSTSNYFSTVFKKYTMYTPKEYSQKFS